MLLKIWSRQSFETDLTKMLHTAPLASRHSLEIASHHPQLIKTMSGSFSLSWTAPEGEVSIHISILTRADRQHTVSFHLRRAYSSSLLNTPGGSLCLSFQWFGVNASRGLGSSEDLVMGRRLITAQSEDPHHPQSAVSAPLSLAHLSLPHPSMVGRTWWTEDPLDPLFASLHHASWSDWVLRWLQAAPLLLQQNWSHYQNVWQPPAIFWCHSNMASHTVNYFWSFFFTVFVLWNIPWQGWSCYFHFH